MESGLHVDESSRVIPYYTKDVRVPNAHDTVMFVSYYKFWMLQVPYVWPILPSDSVAKNCYALKLSNEPLFPNAYSTMVGMLMIDRMKNRIANAFKVRSKRDAPNPN